MRSAVRFPAGMLLAAALLASQVAFGSAGIRLDYDVPPHCPTESHFWRELRQRSPIVDGPRTGGRFSVTVRVERDRHLGALVVEQRGAVSEPRAVDGASCEEVVTALALLTAIALAPPRPRAAPETEEAERAAPREPTAADTARLGLILGAQSGQAPEPSGILSLLSDFRVASRAWFSNIALTLSFATSGEQQRAGRGLNVSLLTLGVHGCAFSWSGASWHTALPCAGAEAGTLRATGAGVPHPSSATAAYLAGQLSASSGLRLWGPLAIMGRVAVSAPLTRHRFIFELPRQEAHRVEALGFTGQLGLAVKL